MLLQIFLVNQEEYLEPIGLKEFLSRIYKLLLQKLQLLVIRDLKRHQVFLLLSRPIVITSPFLDSAS